MGVTSARCHGGLFEDSEHYDHDGTVSRQGLALLKASKMTDCVIVFHVIRVVLLHQMTHIFHQNSRLTDTESFCDGNFGVNDVVEGEEKTRSAAIGVRDKYSPRIRVTLDDISGAARASDTSCCCDEVVR